jgi:ribosomal-protein-alanine N-acetyltransferase
MVSVAIGIPQDFETICDINEVCQKYPEPRKSLLQTLSLPNHHKWVAFVDDRMAGFLISRWKLVNRANIYNVSVLPEYRKQGVATALIQECEKFNAGLQYIDLHVDVNNPAQKLYFDLGYRADQIREDFYGEDTKAIHMWKPMGKPCIE